MPFIPHTDSDIDAMLKAIGAKDIESLFDEIPQSLRCEGVENVPPALNEMEVARLMHERASLDNAGLNFLGGGAYEHHIPAAVWELTTRGEFYSAYTPYQAEASQGTLQVIYEYQTMLSSLMGLDVSNASLYDGATALAEAVLMAIRANRRSKSRRVLMPKSLHPFYREVVHAITHSQGIELVDLAFDMETGTTDLSQLDPLAGQDFAALVIPQPNFFGAIEPVDELTNWAKSEGQIVIGVVNPTAMALLRAPGQWGEEGADIACGEGQPLGVPMSSGGPYFGFLAAAQPLVRQIPGRIVGRTVDLNDKPGFTLTLQAREQHIRRSKATSNICTNQGLLVTAATIYMSLLGPEGLRRVAVESHRKTRRLRNLLSSVDGVAVRFGDLHFHEIVVEFQRPVADVLKHMAQDDIVGGIDISGWFPELGNALLVCATETKTDEDLNRYHQSVVKALGEIK